MFLVSSHIYCHCEECFLRRSNRLKDGFTRVRNDKKAFTLVEIMIVVAIIALLASIAIPNLRTVIRRAELSSWLKTFRVLANASEEYQASRGSYPMNITSLTGAVPPYVSQDVANKCIQSVSNWYVECHFNYSSTNVLRAYHFSAFNNQDNAPYESRVMIYLTLNEPGSLTGKQRTHVSLFGQSIYETGY